MSKRPCCIAVKGYPDGDSISRRHDTTSAANCRKLTRCLFYRSKIEDTLAYAVERLTLDGLELADEMTLSEAGVIPEAAIEAMLALDGGKRKRKKKVYTKPKKVKHVHKKRSLALLDYYLVEDSGKVKKLKMESPHCEVATYMADHADRYVCGKTGRTHFKLTASGERLPIPKQNKPAVADTTVVAKAGPAKGKKKK
jgi:ubiquitin-small subunit ribosomal protein S27Ae